LFDINQSCLQYEVVDNILHYHNTTSSDNTVTLLSSLLLSYHNITTTTHLFNHLYSRHERRPFPLLPTTTTGTTNGNKETRRSKMQVWELPIPLTSRDYTIIENEYHDTNGTTGTTGTTNGNETLLVVKNTLLRTILTFIPQVIPFADRVRLFHSFIDVEKEKAGHSMHHNMFQSPGLRLSLRRGTHFLSDAKQQLLYTTTTAEDEMEVEAIQQQQQQPQRRRSDLLSNALKGRIQIEFISEQGLPEAGIDGGGLFKEYMNVVSKEMISKQYQLFQITSEQLITPHPGATTASDLEMFYFLGIMIGKALYEKLLFQLECAPGFLNMLLGRTNQLDDLYHLDAVLYQSLLGLKSQVKLGKDDIGKLDLYFTVSHHFILTLCI